MSSAIQQLAAQLNRLEREVRAQATTPQLAYSSIEDGGSIDSNADDGTTMAQYGGQFDGSFMAASLVGPVPPVPSLPIMTAGAGTLTIRWDGLFTDAEFAPMDFSRVELHASTIEGFDALSAVTLLGTIESPRGGEAVFVLPMLLHHVRFVTRSLAGIASAPSAEASGTPESVVTDAELAVINASVTAAQVAADAAGVAANNIGPTQITNDAIRSQHILAEEVVAGKLAVDAVLAGNIKAGEITAGKMAAGTITAASGVIGSIDASKITVGQIQAAQLSATAIDGKVITGATFRTAGSGNRWEMSNALQDVISGYTGSPNEQVPAEVWVGSSVLDLWLGISSPWAYGDAASIRLSSDKSTSDTEIFLESTTVTSEGPLFAPNLAGGVADAPYVHVKRTATWTPTTGAWTPIPWTTEVEDSNGFWTVGTPTRLTAAIAGLYQLEVSVGSSVASAFVRYVGYRINGGTQVRIANNSGSLAEINAATFVRLTAGQYLEVLYYASAADTLFASDGLPRASLLWVRR